jgi:hypothetical protein
MEMLKRTLTQQLNCKIMIKEIAKVRSVSQATIQYYKTNKTMKKEFLNKATISEKEKKFHRVEERVLKIELKG